MSMNKATSDKIKQFYHNYPTQRVPKGKLLISAHDKPPGVYYIERGNIRQYTIDQKGNEVTVNIFHRRALVPVSWALNQVENEYYFDTLDLSIIRCAPRTDFIKLLKDNPEISLGLLSNLYFRLDNTYTRIVHLMSSSAYIRILHLLYVQAQRRKNLNPDEPFELKFKSYELAAYCGLSKETVSRQFKKLKKRKIAQMTKTGIKITSLNSLKTELNKQSE